jgi:hypothetical protein
MGVSTRTTTGGGVAARIALTGLGAAGMIFGAFLKWEGVTTGQRVHLKALVKVIDPATSAPARFLHSAGFALIVLALAALVGLGLPTGWVTRIAGALGVIALVLFLIQLYRLNNHPSPGPGVWVGLAGSVMALIGGLLGARRVAVTPSAPAAGPAPADRA